jgi:hypothetical protein
MYSSKRATESEDIIMKYQEFETRVADTFNRMHIVESCDDGFIEAGYENDVGMLLMKMMMDMFHIERVKGTGYVVSRETLMNLYLDDLDEFLLEALDSFNGIMDKYHVVFNANTQYQHCHLHIV